MSPSDLATLYRIPKREAPALEEALMAWRDAYSEAENIAMSHRVLNTRQITQLAALCPTTLAELEVISGFGSMEGGLEGGGVEGMDRSTTGSCSFVTSFHY